MSITHQGTLDIFNEAASKVARRTLPQTLWRLARRKVLMVVRATSLQDLMAPPSNRLESLKGDFKGFFSIRINDQYRVVFRWVDNQAADVEIVDYH